MERNLCSMLQSVILLQNGKSPFCVNRHNKFILMKFGPARGESRGREVCPNIKSSKQLLLEYIFQFCLIWTPKSSYFWWNRTQGSISSTYAPNFFWAHRMIGFLGAQCSANREHIWRTVCQFKLAIWSFNGKPTLLVHCLF